MSKTKKNSGRHSKLTPQVKEKVVSAIRAGNFANVAAGYAGISSSTFYRWLQWGEQGKDQAFVEFWEAVKDAECEAEVRAVATIQKHMTDDWRAAMAYLERKFPERWGRRAHLQVDLDPRETISTLLGFNDEEIDMAVDLIVQHGDFSGGPN